MLRFNLFVAAIFMFCFSVQGQSKEKCAEENCKTYPAVFEEGDISFIDLWVNNIALLKAKFPTLSGTGITIGLKENAPDNSDPDIAGHISSSTLASSKRSRHATTLATLLVGQGVTSPYNYGIAPKAMLVPIDFSNLAAESNEFYQSHFISIVNHSYGTTIENFYSQQARAYDASVVAIPSLLQIFSAGNQGYAPGTGAYIGLSGYANMTGSFKQSKNSLTVGAVDTDKNILAWSSSGPAYDGRIKPEICAFSDEGSSGAATLVSGVAALMQDSYYRQNHVLPDAALIKAVLINSADDVEPKGLDWKSGYGSINAFRAMQILETQQHAKGGIKPNEEIKISLAVPAGARNLKITLSWTDPPAIVNSSASLVNDLDLSVSMGQNEWLPWILNPYPHPDSLLKHAIRGYDRWNTTEQVTIDNVNSDLLSISVNAHASKSEQTFYIAYQWDLPDSFLWTAPTLNSFVDQKNEFTIRWESTFQNEKGILEFSIDNGNTWNLIDDDVSLDECKYVWKSPSSFSSAKLRMLIKGEQYVSDEFKIGPITDLRMLYHCNDSLGVKWNTTSLSEGSINDQVRLYKYNVDSEKWIDLGLHEENPMVIKSSHETDIIAAAPVDALGKEGIRSPSILFTRNDVQCFYKTFTTILLNDSVQIQCELSFPEGVRYIIIEKQLSEMVSLDTILVGADSYYTYYDRNLEDGSNTYRAQLVLTTGQTVYSDFITVIYLKERNFILYPNPITQQDNLTIIANNGASFTIQFFDLNGKALTNIRLYETTTALPIDFLKPGLYLYKINRQNTLAEIGKLLVR